jgi:hypothetical protein
VALTGIDQYSGVDTPQVAVAPDGEINLVFAVMTPSDTIVLFSRSTDGGLTFSTPVTVGCGYLLQSLGRRSELARVGVGEIYRSAEYTALFLPRW